MPTLDLPDARIHYLDHGAGAPVLLLHGFPFNATSFEPQLSALGDRCRFIVPDHRGFGQSAWKTPSAVLEMETLAADALAVLDHEGISEAVVGGVSMGGYVAMALTRMEPSRVRGLVLIDTQATADDEAGKAKREETARAVEASGVQVLVDSMMPRLFGAAAPSHLRQTVEAMIRGTAPQTAAAATRGMGRRSASKEILARYAGPALVVVGEEDVITSPERAQQMVSLLSQAAMVTVPGAGHLSNLERPEPVNEALASLVARAFPH